MMSDQALNAFWGGLLIISIIMAYPVAEKLNKKFQEQNPDCLPYLWGYFLGLAGIVINLGLAVASIAYSIVAEDGDIVVGIILGIIFLITAIPYYFTVKRRGWALVAATVLSAGMILWLTIIIWLASVPYIRKRWKELS